MDEKHIHSLFVSKTKLTNAPAPVAPACGPHTVGFITSCLLRSVPLEQK